MFDVGHLMPEGAKMFDYGHFKFDSKQELFDKAITYWNPDKTKFWQKAGIDLVIDRREGYCLYDMSGRRLIDLHLNGGTYNLGHRNPELVETLKGALDYFDMGNHWFPSVARAALAEQLIKISPGMKYAVFAPGGAEAVDIAIKCARYALGHVADRQLKHRLLLTDLIDCPAQMHQLNS